MKIEFFRTIWWKLLIYFIIIILMTVVVQHIMATAFFSQYMEMERQRDTVSRITRISNSISKEIHTGAELKDEIDYYGSIVGIPLFYFDTDGRMIISAKPEGHRPGGHGHNIQLSMEEIESVKKGLQFISQRRHDKNMSVLVIGYPLLKDGKVIGSLVTLMPKGPPRHIFSALQLNVVIAALIACVIAFLLSRSFTEPIRQMERAARLMAKGDFSERMNLKRKDELGSLAQAFDEMSCQLKKNIEGRMRLMGDISHELNTPLATIKASIEAIQDGVIDTEEGRSEYLKIVLDQINRLSYLIDDVTSLSRFEAGEAKMIFLSFCVSEPALRVVESARIISQGRNITIITDIGDEEMRAYGDPDRIMQALQNLVNNSIQHNPPGTAITLTVKKEKDRVLFSVKDNGRGIPPDQQELIFDRFHKVDKSRTSGQSGSGLGLAIVREILKAHGETVNLSSSEKGTVFSFSLPVA